MLWYWSRLTFLSLSIVAGVLIPPTFAQRGSDGPRVRQLSEEQRGLYTARAYDEIGRYRTANSGRRPAIMLTGYWPPTNEMIRRFSPSPLKNPAGWIGSNWEGRGYDVYAYFPEFVPPDCSFCGQGSGELEVDYQDTSLDFWNLADALEPIAVITFSRGFPGFSWEAEMNQYNDLSWFDDFTPPLQPTPAPPDAGVPEGHKRISRLPVQAIVDAIDAAGLGLSPFICYSQDGGSYLSEFIAYHGVWYQALHADPAQSDWCVAAGHVHVGGDIDWPTATLAAQETLRTVTRYVDTVLGHTGWAAYCDITPNSAGPGATIDGSGTTSVLANSMSLAVAGAPPGAAGLFFYGADIVRAPFGNGVRCVGGRLLRLGPPVSVAGDGTANRALDFTQPPMSSGPGQVSAGSLWNFQFWVRDAMGGGAGFTTSDALSVQFCP